MSARLPESSNTTSPPETSTFPLLPAERVSADGFWGGTGSRLRQEAGSGAAPPLKYTTTHLTYDSGTTEFTRLNGRQYSGKLMEISWGRARKKKTDTPSTRGMSMHAERNRENVLKRAKTAIRRKAMHNNLNYMVTGTTRACIEDREKFGAMVSEWERKVKHFLPKWECIIVLEKQKRGAYHFHAAVHGWQNRLPLMKKLWWDLVGGQGQGAIIVTPPPGGHEGNSQWDIVRLARYLCKYISKAVGEDHVFDKKTYWHTRGIDYPPVISILVESGKEESWANLLIPFHPGRKKHTWSEYNGAIGRTANF